MKASHRKEYFQSIFLTTYAKNILQLLKIYHRKYITHSEQGGGKRETQEFHQKNMCMSSEYTKGVVELLVIRKIHTKL